MQMILIRLKTVATSTDFLSIATTGKEGTMGTTRYHTDDPNLT